MKHVVKVVGSGPQKRITLTCPVCGDQHAATTSLHRALAGSKGDAATPALCWVCRRLYLSVAAEAADYQRMWPNG